MKLKTLHRIAVHVFHRGEFTVFPHMIQRNFYTTSPNEEFKDQFAYGFRFFTHRENKFFWFHVINQRIIMEEGVRYAILGEEEEL